MTEETILQGSDAWKALRLGRVTASRIGDMMAKTKSGPSASRANYCAQLVAERLTGTPAESYVNGAMLRGTETEGEARAAYQFAQDLEVCEVAFVPHPSIEWSGASPDGLCLDDGLVEIKCPNTATHIETLLGAPIDRKYLLQMQWQMACTGRAWCDFASYDNRLPVRMALHIRRVPRDQTLIFEIEREVTVFLRQVSETLASLTDIYGA